jgi:hypothetical protein
MPVCPRHVIVSGHQVLMDSSLCQYLVEAMPCSTQQVDQDLGKRYKRTGKRAREHIESKRRRKPPKPSNRLLVTKRKPRTTALEVLDFAPEIFSRISFGSFRWPLNV